MSRFAHWLTQRRLKSKKPATRLRAVQDLRKLGDVFFLPLFAQHLDDPDANVRRETVLALGDLNDDGALAPLLRALDDRAVVVQEAAAQALKHLGNREAISALVAKLINGSESVQWRAAQALQSLAWLPKTDAEQLHYFTVTGKLDRLAVLGEKAINSLAEVLQEGAPERQVAAANVLGEIGGAAVLKPLQRALRNDNAQLRTAAAHALARAGLIEALPAIAAVLRDRERNVRAAAATALGQLGEPQAVEPLIQLLNDKDWEVRHAALVALGRLGDTRALQPVATHLESDADPDVREVAADALGRVGDDSVLEKLVLTTVDAHSGVRQAAMRALNKIDPAWANSDRVQRLLPDIQAAARSRNSGISMAAAHILQRVMRQRESSGENLQTEAMQKQNLITTILRDMLRDADDVLRCAAAAAAEQLKISVPADLLPPSKLLENFSAEEILICNASGEVLFASGGGDAGPAKLLDNIAFKAGQIESVIGLGNCGRVEIFAADARVIALDAFDRRVLVKTKWAAPETAVVEAVSAHGAGEWLRRADFVAGVQARALRFADRTTVCDVDARGFTPAVLEESLRHVDEMFQLAGAFAPLRLVWSFEQAGLHCARRVDGTVLGAFTSAGGKGVDVARLARHLGEFQAAEFAAVRS